MKTFVKIFLTMIFVILLIVWLTSCKAPVTVSSLVDHSDSTSQLNQTTTIKKDSSYYNQQVLLRMLNRAQTTMSLTRNQVDSLIELLSILPRGTTIIKTDPKLQAQLEIMLDSLGTYQFRCVSNERMYTETITNQSRTINELHQQLNEKTSVSETNKETVKEKQLTFWQKIDNFFKAGGIWLIILLIAIALVGVLKFVPKIK